MNKKQDFLKRISWKKIILGAAVALPVVVIVAQFIYPFNKTMPYASIDRSQIGGLTRDEAVDFINKEYKQAKLNILFGDSNEPYRSPSLETLGVSVDSSELVNGAMYPLWLRLIPTSLWWGHVVIGKEDAVVSLDSESIQSYVLEELGDSCKVAPKDASIDVKDGKLVLRPAEDGGTCDTEEVIKHIEATTISLGKENETRISMKRIAPKVGDEAAKNLIAILEPQLSKDVRVKVNNEEVSLDPEEVASWLVFTSKEDKLEVSVGEDKAKATLTKLFQSKVAKQAGVVTITTKDFTEVSRTGGGVGRTLNIGGTTQNITKYLLGESESIEVATTAIQPEKKYIRSYSSTDKGLSALIQHYAENHKGTFGVSLVELSGQRRRAGYNENKKFTTASTYKLYVAFSTLKRVEKGEYKWSDTITGGRSLSKCFDDMIVLSDNPCAEALVKRISYNAIHKDVLSLGLHNTSFIDAESFKTTAGDLSTFMASLEANQLPLSKDSRSRFIGALKRNVYRQGIPAGVQGTVADKVGFLEGLLHDAAIVYSPSGTYVLSIMTDGSSWSTIADLAKQIQSLRTK